MLRPRPSPDVAQPLQRAGGGPPLLRILDVGRVRVLLAVGPPGNRPTIGRATAPTQPRTPGRGCSPSLSNTT